jgi:3-oxoacyl-[acyl-carrier protein] reductase
MRAREKQPGTGRTVLVTGASKGIGLATCRLLATRGYRVLGISRSEPEHFPGQWYECDLSQPSAISSSLQDILKDGPVDCLVNNAALPSTDRFGEITLDQMKASLDFHVGSVLQLIQGLLPGMRERGCGRIVNILSTTLSGYTERTCYRAGKEALRSLTVSAALELATSGITVNAVAPGPVATETYYAANPPGSPGERYWISLVPMNRFGVEAEIAAAIAFFLCEESSFITGQVLYVDGGMSVGRVIGLGTQ